MVYNSAQSALYKAETENGRCCPQRSDRCDFHGEKRGGKFPEKHPENSCEKHCEKHPENHCDNRHENTCDKRPEKRPELPREDPCGDCPKNPRNNRRGNPIDNLFSDKDMMLIAGLILILLSENADNRLIIALAIVLLG